MNEKKALYIVPAIDPAKEKIVIPDNDVKAFKIDFEKKKNTLKQYKNVEFFNLPQDGQIKPVFYIQLGGRLYFGFTPRLRLFYDHSIKDGFRQDKVEFDYAKSLFGCTGSDTSYKSKVSFSDAVLTKDSKKEFQNDKVILAEPKPSSYLDYLTQSGDSQNTYNSSGFTLRGVKQYWIRNTLAEKNNTVKNEAVYSPVKAIKQGAKFCGKVRFQNLTRDELGLLAWSIRLNDGSWMNVGKAKAYGYGAISVSDLAIKTIDTKKAYDITALSLNPYRDENIDELIREYKKTINEKLQGRTPSNIDELRSVQDFFIMKDSRNMPEQKNIRYMSIDNREYQSRQGALQKPADLVKK